MNTKKTKWIKEIIHLAKRYNRDIDFNLTGEAENYCSNVNLINSGLKQVQLTSYNILGAELVRARTFKQCYKQLKKILEA